MKKSILALLLAVLMVASLLPAAALADGTVAEVDGTEYSSLQQAVNAAAESGKSVELKANIELTERVTIESNKTVTIVGKSFSISFPGTGVGNSAFYVPSSATNVDVNVNGVKFISKAAETSGGYGILVGEATDDVNITATGCVFQNLYCGVYFGHVNSGNTGSVEIDGSTYVDTTYGYSIDTKTTGSTLDGVKSHFGADNTGYEQAAETWTNVAYAVVSGKTKSFSSIQDAVNEADDNSTITVAPGTYNEVVTFGSKSLTIKAQYPAYYNGAFATDAQLSEFTGTFYTGAGSNPGSFKDNQSITIIGFALSGDGLKIGTTNWSTVGSLTVKNCTMEFGADLETTSYYNKSNKFIYVNGGANGAFANFVVEDNYIGGTPLDDNYPLQLWGVNSATVRNNVFELINAENHQAIGISKLAVDADVTVNNNKISGAGGGIYVTTWMCGGDSTGNTAFSGTVAINNNIITGAGAGNFKPIFVGYEGAQNGAFEGTLDEGNNTNNGETIVPEVGQKPGATAYYEVTYYPNNGGDKMIQLATHNQTINLPAAPSKSGYAFLGWNDGVTTYSELAQYTVTKDTTFNAVWVRHPDTEYVPEPEQPVEPETPVFPFYDVPTSAWYYTAVKYVYDNKLMDGVDTYVFAPNDTLTRAMVWTIIARMSGVDTTGGNTWYAKAQEWVITNGISDGENPTAAITRQELVTML